MKKTRLFAWITLFLLGFFAYSNTFNGEFVFDDIPNIVSNEPLHRFDILALWRLVPARFIPFLTFAFNYRLGGLNPFGYHIVNFFLHALNALLVFWFIRSVTKSKYVPFIITSLFLLHPIQTQAVSYISQRFTLLAAFFYLLTLCLYIRARAGKQSPLLYISSLLTAFLAFFSKENTYTLPVAVCLIEYAFLRKVYTQNLKYKLSLRTSYFVLFPFFILSFFSFFLYRAFPQHEVQLAGMIPAVSNVPISRWQYAITQLPVVVKYIRLFVFPVGQTIDHDVSLSQHLLEVPVILSFLFHLGIIFVSGFFWKKNRLVSFGIVFFYLTLSIESSFIPLADIMNEHRLYLPSVGFFIAVVSFLFSVISSRFIGLMSRKPANWIPAADSRKQITGFILFSLLILLAFLTHRRNGVWRAGESLWTDAIAKSSDRARPHFALGMVHLEKKDEGSAIAEFQKAIDLNPFFIPAYNNLGTVYNTQGKGEEAIAIYQNALVYDPDNAIIRNALGSVLAQSGREKEAVIHFQHVIEMHPQDPQAYNNLGVLFAKRGNKTEALRYFTKALELDPSYEKAKQNMQKL